MVSKVEDGSNPETKNEVNSQARDKEERKGSKSLEKINSNDDIHMNQNDECYNKMMIDNSIDYENEEKIVSEMKLKMKKIRDINSKYDEEIMKYVDSIIPKGDSLKARIDTIKLFISKLAEINRK